MSSCVIPLRLRYAIACLYVIFDVSALYNAIYSLGNEIVDSSIFVYLNDFELAISFLACWILSLDALANLNNE